jgi:hypothetical protein
MSKPKVDDATDALLIIRRIAIDCDSELSAQAHGRPPSDKETLAVLSQSCRNVYEGAFPLVDRIKTALAAAQRAGPECPACGWQNDQEALDCEAAYERATGRKLEPGDREFLDFRAGWIAGHTRAALPAGPSETEVVNVDWEFAKAYRPDQPDNIEVDNHFYVAAGWYKSGWADAMKHVAAQPKAPSPSDDEPPECGCCGMVCYGDTCSGCGWERKAPSPTPGEEALEYIEEAFNCAEDSDYAECSDCGCVSPTPTLMHHKDCETARHLATLRAALPAQPQPMEIAPRDGTRILAAHGREWVVAFFADAGQGWRSIYGVCIEPTAWLPLPIVPTPPNAEPGERSGG